MGLAKITQPDKPYMEISRDEWKKIADQLKAENIEIRATMIKYYEMWVALKGKVKELVQDKHFNTAGAVLMNMEQMEDE